MSLDELTLSSGSSAQDVIELLKKFWKIHASPTEQQLNNNERWEWSDQWQTERVQQQLSDPCFDHEAL